MGLLAKIFKPLVLRATEGEFRPGPYYLPYSGGWLPDGVALNWWQQGGNIDRQSGSALVEACVAAYSQSIAQCPGDHWKTDSKGGKERVTTSALHRLLRYPNEYETTSNFLLNLVRWLYIDGNAYALAIRNDRFEIEQLHLMDSRVCQAAIAETGDVFYYLGGNYIVDRLVPDWPLVVPARDVMHIRLNETNQMRPLRGESPLVAAARDIAVNDAILGQQIQFYLNQARPSTVLTTDMVLDRDQVAALRDRWNEQSRGINAGGTPILTAGLKPVPLATTSKEAELAQVAKMSQENVAMAFGVPLAILGIGSTAATEELMRFWLARSLGFAINHVEESFNQIFDLKGYPEEWIEFDTSALLRMAEKDQIDALARGVSGGVYTPNEARARLNLSKKTFADEPRLQAQVVPLSAAGQIQPASSAPASLAPHDAPPSAIAPPANKQGEQKDVEPLRIKHHFNDGRQRAWQLDAL